MSSTRCIRRAVTLLAMTIAATSTTVAGAGAATTGTISGAAFQDGNRNGVQDAGEPAWEGHQLYLFDGAGSYRGTTTSNASGTYVFSGLADGRADPALVGRELERPQTCRPAIPAPSTSFRVIKL
jgi:hypothetical protein